MINKIEFRDNKCIVGQEQAESSLPEALQAALRAAGRVTYLGNETRASAASFHVGAPLPISHDGPLMEALNYFRDEIFDQGIAESMPAAEGALAVVALCGTGAECWSWITTHGPKPTAERVITSAKATLAVLNVAATLSEGMHGLKPTLTVVGFVVKVAEETYVYVKGRQAAPRGSQPSA